MKCTATAKNGLPCPNNAGHKFNPDGLYCYLHDPEMVEHRNKAKVAGNVAWQVKNKKPENLDDYVIEKLQYVIDMLETFKRTPEVARAFTASLSTLDKALERRANLLGRGDLKIVVNPSAWETGAQERQFELWAVERGYHKD